MSQRFTATEKPLHWTDHKKPLMTACDKCDGSFFDEHIEKYEHPTKMIGRIKACRTLCDSCAKCELCNIASAELKDAGLPKLTMDEEFYLQCGCERRMIDEEARLIDKAVDDARDRETAEWEAGREEREFEERDRAHMMDTGGRP